MDEQAIKDAVKHMCLMNSCLARIPCSHRLHSPGYHWILDSIAVLNLVTFLERHFSIMLAAHETDADSPKHPGGYCKARSIKAVASLRYLSSFSCVRESNSGRLARGNQLCHCDYDSCPVSVSGSLGTTVPKPNCC